MELKDFEIEDNILVRYHGDSEHVAVPDGITEIAQGAFNTCRSIRSVKLPESVETIGAGAFHCCFYLEEINIPEKVTRIESGTFYDCKLKKIQLPEKLTCIGREAFYKCDIEEINIPETVTEIGWSAFDNCNNLKEIAIPASVEKIEEMAFCSCKSLREIRVSEQNPNYTSIDGVLYDKAVTALICCPGGKESVTIPETVTRIEPSAFDGCAELKEIILPEQVSFIGRYAFLHCGMMKLYIPASVTEIQEEAIRSCNFLKEIHVSEQNPNFASVDGVLYDKSVKTLIHCPETRTELIIPETVTEIPYNAFENCDDLKSVTIPDGAKIIDYTFTDCYQLNQVCYHGIEFIIHANIYNELAPFFKLIDEKDLSVKIKFEEKCPIVMELFSRNPEDEKIIAYIRKTCSKTFQFLIDENHSEMLEKLLNTGLFITKKNIDKFIQYANQNQKHEIQLLLTDYKYQHFEVKPKNLKL